MKCALSAVLLATAAMAAPARQDEATRAAERTATRADRPVAMLARQVGDAEAGMRAARLRAASAAAAEQAQAIRVSEARAPLAGMVAAIARIARRPPVLALANGSSIADAAHLSLLVRHMRQRIAVQHAALTEELARQTALREDSAHALAALDAARRGLDQRRLLLAQSRVDPVERSAVLADAGDVERERMRGPAEEGAAGEAPGDSRREQALSEKLGRLPGPVLRPGAPPERSVGVAPALYRLPGFGRVVAGTGERDADGVRARGITLATAPGLPVPAPAAGRVLYAGPFRNYGDIVIIDHGHGWTSLVAGLAPSSAELGAHLVRGATIGRSARRLLMELRHDGHPVDIVAMADALRT